MNDNGCVDEVEVKRANIAHHDVEAEIFEHMHPEGSSVYERAKVSESIALITDSSTTKSLCVDIGCGTGFLTNFELPFYEVVVATDISRKMLEVTKRRFKGCSSLFLVACDADFLPFNAGIADLISISSVLHHLPNPCSSLGEVSRVLKGGGFVYITREPNFQRFRRFFAFFDLMIVRSFVRRFRRLPFFETEVYEECVKVEGLDYANVDVHFSTGFHLGQLVSFLRLRFFDVISAYSYHWIYAGLKKDFLDTLLTRSNFLIEKVPLSRRLGRYLCIIARKTAKRK